MAGHALVLAVATWFSLHAAAQPGDYYYFGERRVALTLSDRGVGYLVPDDQAGAFNKLSDSAGKVVKVELPGLRDNYQLRLLLIAPDVTPAERRTILAELRRPVPGLRQAPLYETDGVVMVMVDRFSVRFAPGVDQRKAERFLREELKATSFEQEKRFPGHYRVVLGAVAPVEGLRMLNRLQEAQPGIVETASPAFVRFFPRPPEPQDEEDPGETPGETAEPPALPPDPTLPPTPAPIGDREQPSRLGYRQCELESAPGEVPNDNFLGRQWALENTATSVHKGVGTPGADINALPAWDVTRGSEDIVIAVVDIGIDLDHPDLASRIHSTGYAFQDVPNPTADVALGESSHGTAVAGLAAAVTDNGKGIAGVDWHAKIYPAQAGISGDRCEDIQGTDVPDFCEAWYTTPFSIPDAIMAAVDAGAHVLVNSWNGTAGGDLDAKIDQAFDYAISRNRVVVVSAGNHYQIDCEDDPIAVTCVKTVRFPGTLVTESEYAAVRDGLIVVSATNENDHFKTYIDDDLQPPSVDHSASVDWGSNRGPQVTLAAPGNRLYTTIIVEESDATTPPEHVGYACSRGTSAAAPLVGAAASLLLSLHPQATAAEIKQWLTEGAAPPPERVPPDIPYPPVPNELYGYGRLDLMGALTAAEALLMLEVEGVNKPVRRSEERKVTARVTRNGEGVENALVRFRVSETTPEGYLVLASTQLLTDSNGWVRTRLKADAENTVTATITAEYGGKQRDASLQLTKRGCGWRNLWCLL